MSGIMTPDGRVTLGSMEKEIHAILGYEKSNSYGVDYTMEYDNVTLYLSMKTSLWSVIGWYNNGNAKVSVGDKVQSASPITMGSSMQDVINAAGSPYYIESREPDDIMKTYYDTYWEYADGSCVYFGQGYNVNGWINNGGLKVSTGTEDPNAAPFKLGSSYDDVTRAMGTPDQLYASNVNDIKWKYGDSIVYFTADGKVKGFENKGNLKVNLGDIDPSSPGIKVGSTSDDIVKAMGTPDAVTFGRYFDITWKYGDSYIGVDSQGIVTGWVDKGNLKIAN